MEEIGDILVYWYLHKTKTFQSPSTHQFERLKKQMGKDVTLAHRSSTNTKSKKERQEKKKKRRLNTQFSLFLLPLLLLAHVHYHLLSSPTHLKSKEKSKKSVSASSLPYFLSQLSPSSAVVFLPPLSLPQDSPSLERAAHANACSCQLSYTFSIPRTLTFFFFGMEIFPSVSPLQYSSLVFCQQFPVSSRIHFISYPYSLLPPQVSPLLHSPPPFHLSSSPDPLPHHLPLFLPLTVVTFSSIFLPLLIVCASAVLSLCLSSSTFHHLHVTIHLPVLFGFSGLQYLQLNFHLIMTPHRQSYKNTSYYIRFFVSCSSSMLVFSVLITLPHLLLLSGFLPFSLTAVFLSLRPHRPPAPESQ